VDLAGRSALVAGGAGGLGAATVRHLAGVGLGVVAFDRGGDRLDRLTDELGGAAVPVRGDTGDDADVGAAIAAAESLGALSVVVNAAGGGGLGEGRTLAEDSTPHAMDVFVRTMAGNAFGTFNVARLAAAAMAGNEPDADGQRGVVVNTASIAGEEGQAGQVAYGSAKAAILGMTLPMARDLAPVGIRVCAIAPGPMATPALLRAPEPLQRRLAAGIPFPPRLGRPEEFARLIESIVRNPYLNGVNIRLDGALRLPPE
jgi:NAD(P)-dependent dehydrogenase (short-subunit alcohol dehydrogenase family)